MKNHKTISQFIISENAPAHDFSHDYIISFPLENANLYIVSDGVGLNEEKAAAAQLTAMSIKEMISKPHKNISEQIKRAIYHSNQALIDYVTNHKYITGIGASVIIAVETTDCLYYTIIGKSILFLIRNKQISLINYDTIYHNKEIKYLGNSTLKHIEIVKNKLYEDDLYIFSTQSFLKYVTRMELLKYCSIFQFDNLKINLLSLIRTHHLHDDISMIFLKVENGARMPVDLKAENQQKLHFLIAIIVFILCTVFFVNTYLPFVSHLFSNSDHTEQIIEQEMSDDR